MKSIKEKNNLRIYRQNSFAGTLSRTADGCVFKFEPDFLTDPNFKELSFAIPKNHAPIAISGINLHPFFAGLLPEGLRLKTILTNLKTSADDLFSLFAATGAGAIGDVYVKTELDIKKTFEASQLKKIDFYDYFLKLTKSNPYAKGEDSIAGVQEKVSASMISFPLNIAKKNKSYILKLNPKDKPNLVENELYCMKLAAKCKIKTAVVKIVTDKNSAKGLLVERFDRIWDHDLNRFQKIHQEDACQILNIYPSEKYRVSINDIATGLKPVVSSDLVSLSKLIQLMAFSYLIGNGDLHAKNISVLSTAEGFTDLTPAYDLICTLIYGDAKMALKLDGKDDNLKRKVFIDFGKRFGVSDLIINKMLDQLTKDFLKNYQLLKEIPMSEKNWVFLQKTITKRLKDLS